MAPSGSVGAKIHDLAHASNTSCLRFGPKSGKLMATGADDGVVRMWALGRDSPLLPLAGCAAPVSALAIDWPEEYLIVASTQGPIKLWDLRQAKVARTLIGHRLGSTAVEFHPFGEFFISGGKDSQVKVWDVKKSGCIHTYSSSTMVSSTTPLSSSGNVQVLRITPDGRWIASGWEDGSVKIWDMTAGKLLKTFTDSKMPVTSITFSPFEFLMTVSYKDGRVWFYDLESFDVMAATPRLGGVPRAVEFHSQGREVLVACENSIQVWGWDPLICHDSIPMNWPRIADIKMLEEKKLVGATLDQNMVGIWGLKIDRMNPYKPLPPPAAKPTLKDSYLENLDHQKADNNHQMQHQSFILEAQPNISTSRPETSNKDAANAERSPSQQSQHRATHPSKQPLPYSQAHPPQTASSHIPQQNQFSAKPSAFIGASGGSVPLNLDISKFAPQLKRTSPSLRDVPSSSSISSASNAVALHDTGPVPPTSENDVINTLSFRNTSMTLILSGRLHALQEIRSLWDEANVKPAVEKLMEFTDHGVWVDMLKLMNGRAKVFTLDVAILLLPLLNELLFEVYEDYFVEACNTIKLLCKSFAQLIISQLGNSTFSSPGIDLTREERRKKCLICYESLKDIQLTLSEFTRSSGKVGTSVKEVLIEFPVKHCRNEVGGFEDRARYLLSIAKEALADKELPKEGFKRFIRREPMGVVLIISAWNYPYLVSVNGVVPALLSGNTVLLKQAPQTLPTADRFFKAFEKAGLPTNVFQTLPVDHAVAAVVLQDPRIDHAHFTGSVRGGHEVSKTIANKFMGLGLELGGKDPAYVRADADPKHAAENLVDGAMYNSGQSCCGVERIYVHESVFDAFVAAAVETAKEYKLGDSLQDDAVNLGPVVNVAAADNIRAHLDDAVKKGAKLLVDEALFPAAKPGTAFIAPQILVNVDHTMRIMKEETFGPVVGVMKVKSDEEAIAFMNDSDFGLTASIWTKDVDTALKIGDQLECGTVFLNRCDFLDPALPWSGVKDSGRGVTLSYLGFDAMTRPKAFHFRLQLDFHDFSNAVLDGADLYIGEFLERKSGVAAVSVVRLDAGLCAGNGSLCQDPVALAQDLLQGNGLLDLAFGVERPDLDADLGED
ncbi:hypothetical protein HK100_003223, partial [Physocladia obscura]